MTPHATSPDERFVGLSCYTGNLACYMAAEFPGTDAQLARSIRLAVRTDASDGRLAFSHHRHPLDCLPDGTRLRYAAAADRAVAAAELANEMADRGRVLVVTDNARLPWSPSYRGGPAAPHLLLVDGHDHDHWHVADAFSGLMADGEQSPFAGWLSTEALLSAMVPPATWSDEQKRRNELAFGFPVTVPAAGALWWLRRDDDDGSHAHLPGDWLLEDRHALPFLADYVAAHPTAAERHLDDLWSAARHRVFAHRWHQRAGGLAADERALLEAAACAWDALPRAVRFIVDSARRGRPRDSLVHTTFDHLLACELALEAARARSEVPGSDGRQEGADEHSNAV